MKSMHFASICTGNRRRARLPSRLVFHGHIASTHVDRPIDDAAHGFAALGALDSNHDGQVNAQDSAWASLKLWKDLNGNGITDDGELIGLGDAGVSSLGVGHTSSTQTDAQGNQHRQLGSFTRSDGSSGAMHDVWFATDAVHHREVDPVAESAAIEALPDVRGLGNVHSLRQAMARDASRWL